MTNTKKLKAIFVEHGKTQYEVAKMIGISKTSLSYKLNNKKEFRLSEVKLLCDYFNIKDVENIFFAK